MRVILVTGMSGSGKSIALHVLEDAGYAVVDNLPARFLVDIVDDLDGRDVQACRRQHRHPGRDRSGPRAAVAAAVAARSRARRAAALHHRRQRDARPALLGDAASPSAVRRRMAQRASSPTRAASTRASTRSVACSSRSKDLGHVIDTSRLPAQALREWVRDFIGNERAALTLSFESFAFKQGVPADADLVFDVRCLPNPFYVPALKPLTGLDAPGHRVPRSRSGGASDDRRHRGLPAALAAELRGRQPQLPDGRDRLHRRAAPLGLLRRVARRAARRSRIRRSCGIARSHG